MSYRVVMRPDKSLGVFNDAADTWVYEALGDEDAVDLIYDAEGIDPDEIREVIGQLRRKRLSEEHDGFVMSWAEAGWRAGGRHGDKPLERDKNGLRIWTHGTRGWRWGCKCDVCTQAHLGDNRERYRTPDRNLTHGLSGYAQGCKCEVCTEAHAADQRSRSGNPRSNPRPPMLDAGDLRDKNIKVSVSGTEESLIFELALEDGMAASVWIMDKFILPELEERRGYVSPRRPAPRRPNREPRARKTEAGGQQQ